MIDSEEAFRVAYEQALRKAGAFVEYLHSRERQGIPDLHYAARGFVGWQELKFVSQLPARPDAGVLGHKVTAQQRIFLAGVSEQGGLGVVAVGHWERSRLLVSFFWSHQVSREGQISLSQFQSCVWRACALDGAAAVDVLTAMAEESRHAWNQRQSQDRAQLAAWPSVSRSR